MKMTRREFCMATAAQAILPSFADAGAGKRWYKGNLHCHTYWSDGRAFPDQAIRSYRDAGYDFCAVTDHNRIDSNRDFWRWVKPDEGRWPPLVCRRNFELYMKEFPWAQSRERDGGTEVRLLTVDELVERYGKPGEFLVMKGMEITRMGAESRHMHMNYVNLDAPIPGIEDAKLIQTMPADLSNSDIVRKTRAEVAALAESLGNPPHICFLNHPQWRYYDVVAGDAIANPDVRFFEVCNNASDFPPVGLLPDDGFYNDRFWDAVNAVRAKAGQPLLYAVANDDCHFYPCTKTESVCTFGEAFTMVRADELTPKALFAAMERGDSYASCGVVLDDVQFDGKTLHVSAPAKDGVAFTVRFIATKRGADTEAVQFVSLPARKDGRPARTVPVYSKDVGATVKCVAGGKGTRIEAEYSLAEDDLYVRARVESDERAPYYVLGGTGAIHPKVSVAWTQPYQRA